MDRRVRPDRVAAVIAGLDADVIALQEVSRELNGPLEKDQPRYLGAQLEGYSWHFGETRRRRGVIYGNAILTRLPVFGIQNYSFQFRGREQRGCLRVDVMLPGDVLLHVFNVHLGTGFFERRHQGRELLSANVLRAAGLEGPRIVLGDFNEWTRGLTTQLMAQHFDQVDVKAFLPRRRTYPGVLPLLHLDRVYYDRSLRLEDFVLDRSRTALIASDHLPMIAGFAVRQAVAEAAS